MKKRNKPIVLTTLLALMLGAVAFVQFPKDAFGSKHGPGDGHDHGQAEAPKTGNEVQVPDKNAIASSVANSVKGGGPGGGARPSAVPGRPGMPPGMGEGESKPLIAVEKYNPPKPAYNDSATSTQWYSSDTPEAPPKK